MRSKTPPLPFPSIAPTLPGPPFLPLKEKAGGKIAHDLCWRAYSIAVPVLPSGNTLSADRSTEHAGEIGTAFATEKNLLNHLSQPLRSVKEHRFAQDCSPNNGINP